MLISSHRDSTVSVVCNTINPRGSFDVFVVFNIFCCSKFSLVLLSVHFISDNLSPSVPPWNPCHPPKSSTPSPLKINIDWCGPLDRICVGSFIDVILEKLSHESLLHFVICILTRNMLKGFLKIKHLKNHSCLARNLKIHSRSCNFQYYK